MLQDHSLCLDYSSNLLSSALLLVQNVLVSAGIMCIQYMYADIIKQRLMVLALFF